ncbi:MAG: histidinol-phosphate transaminase [Cyanobacteria bacterium P01_A01_bin.114]
MLPFIRDDIAELAAYKPHPGPHLDPREGHPRLDPLDTNESPYDLPDVLKAALAEQYQQAISTNRYPDGGHLSLKRAIAAYVIESGFTASGSLAHLVQPEHISVGNGSDELIRSLLIATCLGGNGSILVAAPTFSMYGILAKTLGIPVISVDRHAATFEVDLAAAQQSLETHQGPPVRVVFMVHPNSPTGNALTDAELDWLRSLREDILVVVDEAYFEFSQHTTVADALSRPNWVVLRTFSKAFRLAAHRVGYAVAQPPLIQALEKVRLPYNLPSFSQSAAETALAHRSQLLASVAETLKERDKMAHRLSCDARFQVWPSQANFLYGRLSQLGLHQLGYPDLATGLADIFQRLRSQGTLIRYTGGGLRFTLGSPDENQRTWDHLQAVLTVPAAI